MLLMDMPSKFGPIGKRHSVREDAGGMYADCVFTRYYCLSILDKHHHPDITLGQGIKLLNLCTDELKRRLPIDFKGMIVKAIKADGIVDIEFDDDKIVKCA